MGGNPSSVNFNTVTIGTACANVYEGNKLDLTCQGGRTLGQIRFASFGDPQGICGSFAKGCCEANNDILSLVGKACLGKEKCSIDVSERRSHLAPQHIPAVYWEHLPMMTSSELVLSLGDVHNTQRGCVVGRKCELIGKCSLGYKL